MLHTIKGTDTQLAVLLLLQRYRCLPSTYVCELLGESYTYFKRFVFPKLRRERQVSRPATIPYPQRGAVYQPADQALPWAVLARLHGRHDTRFL